MTAARKSSHLTAHASGPNASRADHVYLALKQDIFNFRLLPGDSFTESEVAERMAVSRTPVREALFRLERDGYLQVHFRSGWSVKPFDFQQFEDLYDLRLVLETASIRRLSDQTDPIGLEELTGFWMVPPEQRLTDELTVSGLDEKFHVTLVESAGNPEISRVHSDVMERIRIVRRLDFTQAHRIEKTYDEHNLILQAIMHHRADQAIDRKSVV